MKQKLLAFLLIVAVMMLTLMPSTAVADDNVPEGFDSWDDYYNSLIYGEQTSVEVPAVDQMEQVAQNDRLTLYYHEAGADFYVKDRQSGNLWGSAIHPDDRKTDDLPDEDKTLFLSVNYADASQAIVTVDLVAQSSDTYQINQTTEDGKLMLKVELTDTGISFMAVITLEKDGISCSVPDSSITEEKDCRLLSISMLPLFGSASCQEDGYIFYPDGCGALMNLNQTTATQTEAYSFPLYGLNAADLTQTDTRENLDIKNMMLPVTGIKRTKSGFLAAMEAGAANGKLNIKAGVNDTANFEMTYRSYETAEYSFSFTKGSITKLLKNRAKADFTVRYFLLNAPNNTYSDMANVYRTHLVEQGVLKKLKKTEQLPLSLELFMSISKSGLFTKKLQVLTNFEDAQKMVADLNKSGIRQVDLLLQGWAKGGYSVLPTADGAESKLGGIKGLQQLAKVVGTQGGQLSLAADLLQGNTTTGQFNAKQNAIRNSLDMLVTDQKEQRYLLSPNKYLIHALNKLAKQIPDGTQLSLTGMGTTLLPDGSDNGVSRTQMESTVTKALQSQKGKVAVSGGNAYVLGLANRLYDIPDLDSQYYQTSRAVPFYQMVLHGYVNYTSLAGNCSYDTADQKLRWMETGSIPHFTLTKESPVLLRDTGYDKLFSSEYESWKQTVLSTWSSMNDTLGDVWEQEMIKHEYLTDTLVRVTYSGGGMLYLNYGDCAVEYDHLQIDGMNSLFVKGA